MRRLTNLTTSFMRNGYVSPPALGTQEPSSKRRTTEKHGQIEMEQLPLELRYCDGGRYDQGGGYYTSDYSPECALRDDSTVYCTKAPSCNMILRHVNGQCFSLQKLVIRAPPNGYTSPVRAGMIFVTMDETDLLSKTDYNVRYERSDDEDDDTSEDEDADFRLLETDPCEVEATDTRRSIFVPAPHRTSEGMVGPSRLNPSTGSATLPGSSSSSALWANLDEQFSRPPPPVELLEPNATFSHKDRRTKCVINFEPAISGRFILAKFFSTHQSKNIDIEFVGAFGWTGRRFFPAVTMR